ncbi:MAG: hypothetical protein V4631_14715 [Pseudomonadota bacterium]
MQNKFLALCAVAALAANPGLVQAQVGNGGATYSEVNNKTSLADFMPKFISASRIAIAAQASMDTTVGMADQANALTAQASEMKLDSAPGIVEKVMDARAADALALNAKLASAGLTIDAAKKPQFTADIEDLARSIKQFEELSSDLPYMKTQLRGAGAKGRTGLFVAKSLPGYSKEMKAQLAAAVAFARANAIPFAPEVNAALAP